MNCRLCCNNYSNLENSHIVPEWVYKPIYDDKNRFISISADNSQKLKVEQKGYREKLLCKSCEGKLSQWENKASRDLRDIHKGRSNFLDFAELGKNFTMVNGINADAFKRCMLSILWRMSIASHENFKSYSLGMFENKIRDILSDNEVLLTFDFPLMIQQIMHDGEHVVDLMMCVNKGRINNRYTVQSFVIYGFLIEIIVSKQRFRKDESFFLLNHQGWLCIKKTEFLNLRQEKTLLDRFEDDDVNKFYG